MCLGDRVSWHFLGVGSSKDLHGVALEGNAMAVNGRTLDAKIIIPGLGFTGYMHPDNVGESRCRDKNIFCKRRPCLLCMVYKLKKHTLCKYYILFCCCFDVVYTFTVFPN